MPTKRTLPRASGHWPTSFATRTKRSTALSRGRPRNLRRSMRASSLPCRASLRTPNSVKLTLFLEGVVDALKQIQGDHKTKLANESRQLCRAVLRMVLVKVAHRNPGLNLTNALLKLPKNLDTKPLEALVEPIVAKVDEIVRVEGEHRN